MRLTQEQVEEIRPLLEAASYGNDCPKLILGMVRHCAWEVGLPPVKKDDYEMVISVFDRELAHQVLGVISGELTTRKQPVKKLKEPHGKTQEETQSDATALAESSKPTD